MTFLLFLIVVLLFFIWRSLVTIAKNQVTTNAHDTQRANAVIDAIRKGKI